MPRVDERGLRRLEFAQRRMRESSEPITASEQRLRNAVMEYLEARQAYEDATRPSSGFAQPIQLPHGSPITKRWTDARLELSLAAGGQ